MMYPSVCTFRYIFCSSKIHVHAQKYQVCYIWYGVLQELKPVFVFFFTIIFVFIFVLTDTSDRLLLHV